MRNERTRALIAMLVVGTATPSAIAACGDSTSDNGGGVENDASSPADGSPTGTDAAKDVSTGGDTGSDTGAPNDAGSETSTDADADIETDADAAADADASMLDVDFVVDAPAHGYAGVTLDAVTVRVRDNGVLVANPVSVTLSVTGGPGALGGTVMKDTTAGLVAFDDLTISKSGSYKLVATVTGASGQSATTVIDAWQPYNGSLAGGTIRRLAVDPTNANIAYAATDTAGIFRTMDGATWSQVGFPGTSTAGLAIDPTTPTTIYAGQDNKGLYKSLDRGQTWAPANTGYTNKYVSSLAIDKANTQIVYWGTNTGLLKSTDGGGTWNPISDPAFATTQVAAIAIAPSNSQTLYAQSYNQQIYKSTNGGTSWTPMTGLPANALVRTLVVHPTDETIVFAGLGETAGGGVWKSSAGGAFTQVANAPVATAFVEDIVIVPSSPQTMFLAAYASNVYKSTDGGSTWSSLNDNLHGGNTALALGMAASDTNTLYVGHYVISGGGFSKSTNAGGSWADASKGFVAFDVNGIAIDPASSNNIWVGGGYNGLNKSTDKGVNYTQVTGAAGFNANGSIPVCFSPVTSTTLFAATNGGGLWQSVNAGTSFVHNNVLGNVAITQIAPSPADANTIYAAGGNFGVTATANGGAAWTSKTTPSSPWAFVGGLAAHPAVAATAYVGVGDGLYRTTDSGQTWNKLTTPAPALFQPYVAFDSANNLYAAQGAVESSPDGDTWTDITSTGGTTVPVSGNGVSYLGVFKVAGADVVFVGVGSKNGLWRRSGGVWKQSLVAATNILTMTQDPAQPTTLYVGLKTGGMYRSLSAGE